MDNLIFYSCIVASTICLLTAFIKARQEPNMLNDREDIIKDACYIAFGGLIPIINIIVCAYILLYIIFSLIQDKRNG